MIGKKLESSLDFIIFSDVEYSERFQTAYGIDIRYQRLGRSTFAELNTSHGWETFFSYFPPLR